MHKQHISRLKHVKIKFFALFRIYPLTFQKSIPETDRYVKNINDIYGYKIKQGIKVNEDLLELLSIYDKNAKVDTNGNVTVYHRTNADAADFLGKA